MHHRFNISDAKQKLIEAHLTEQSRQHGDIARGNLKFINVLVLIPKTVSPWRNLPPSYGKWSTIYQRFIRWQ